jgi:hypothetical protein
MYVQICALSFYSHFQKQLEDSVLMLANKKI